MKNIKNFAKDVVKKVVDDLIDEDFYKWPPECNGIFCQPVRPRAVKKEDEIDG